MTRSSTRLQSGRRNKAINNFGLNPGARPPGVGGDHSGVPLGTQRIFDKYEREIRQALAGLEIQAEAAQEALF